MIAFYFLLSALIALAAAFARQRRTVKRLGAAFYLVQLSLVAHIVAEGYGEVSSQFFRFDAAGTLFFALLTVVSAFVFVHSCVYLRDNPIKEYRLYFTLLMLLTTAITGVYFARNIAVTWIFLEATTLCAAGIVYHRRTAQALSDVEIHLRLLGRHRHGLSGHPAALVAGRRFAALRGAGAQRRRRQPALPENRLSTDPLRLQLQDGDLPALHDRRRRQFRRAGTRLGADLDRAGQRRLSGRFPRLSHHGADRSDRLGAQHTAADGHPLAGRGRAVPAAHEQLQALPLLLHGREHGHRRDRTGHRRHRRLGRGVPRRLPHAGQRAASSCKWPSCGASTTATASTASATTSASTPREPWDCSSAWPCCWPFRPRRSSSRR